MALLNLGKIMYELGIKKDGDWEKGFQSADKDLMEHEGKWKGFASNMGGVIKGAVVGSVVAIGAAVGAMAIAGGKSAIELQDHMAKFKSATGSTAEETEKVKKTVQELYKVNEDSYEDIAKAAETLSNAMGMNADDIGKYAQDYMNYAKVTGQATEDAIGAIDDLGDAWSLTYDEQTLVMDKLLVLNQEYGMSVQDSQAALTKMAPAAKAVGMSMDEATGYLAMFAETGIDAGTASTAFNKALQKVKSPEEFKTLVKDIESCEDPFERAQKASELFGAKAGPQMAQALGESNVSIDGFIEQMAGTEGAVTKASDAYDGSLKVQLALMKKQFGGLFEELAERLLPIINTLLGWVMDNMPAIQETLTTVFNIVGDVIGFFGGIIQDLINTFVDWYNQNTETVNNFKTMFLSFLEWAKEIFKTFTDIIKAMWELISEIWSKYGEDITNIAKTYFEYIQTIISVAMNIIKDVINIVMAVIKGDWSGAWEGVKSLLSNVWNGMWDIVESGLSVIGSIFAGAYHILLDAGKGAMNAVWDGMKAIWSGLIGWVSNKVTELGGKLAFWRKGKNEMNGGSESVAGSFYNGLDYVPYDGYIARLHEGERVLTKEENKGLANGEGQKSIINFNGNYGFNDKTDIDYFMNKAALLVARKR